jgi:hypothetical protein
MIVEGKLDEIVDALRNDERRERRGQSILDVIKAS